MSFSLQGIRITVALLILCGVFFFYNRRPKFFIPSQLLFTKNYFFYKFSLFVLVIVVVLLPLHIAFVDDTQIVTIKDVPIQIILDVSLSMAANDIVPSRFSAAKQSLVDLVQTLDGYYVSLITFSGKPFLFIPFSSDTSAVVKKLSAMNLGDFPPVQDFLGTAIGDALLLGVDILRTFSTNDTYQPWIVILITDGDANVGFDPLQVISYYQELHVPLFVLGVGQEQYLIWRDRWNDTVMTDINLSLLQKLADESGGQFFRILGQDSFDQFVVDLSESIVARQYQQVRNKYRHLNDYLVYLIIFLLVWLVVFRIYLLLSVKRNSSQ